MTLVVVLKMVCVKEKDMVSIFCRSVVPICVAMRPVSSYHVEGNKIL